MADGVCSKSDDDINDRTLKDSIGKVTFAFTPVDVGAEEGSGVNSVLA
jgi:hypothetical protein